MQVTEVTAQGLKREYKVVIPAGEIQSRVQSRLERIQRTIRMPGFRPGKAPLPLLRKQYGNSVMGEVLEEAIDEGAKKALADNQLRPALRPKIDVGEIGEGKDLEFQVALEVLPEVPEVDVEGIELSRPVAALEPAQVDEALDRLAKARQGYEAPAEARPAQDGDQVVIDFAGSIDGTPFDGGTGKDFTLSLGSRSMIPGFEDAILGMSAGEAKTFPVTFPEDYAGATVAGKEASFEITLKEVKAPVPFTIDDDWAKSLGAEGLEELRGELSSRLDQERKGASRTKLKRSLLDVLAARYPFDVPQGMVEMEFESIWKQFQAEAEREGLAIGSGPKSEDELKAEYRSIAERRVRLGLILSDIGTRNGVTVENEELQQAMVREAMRFPQQAKEVFEFFRSNPGAMEQLRAPIFEDKVCDLIFSKAKVEEKPVSMEELMAEPEEDEALPVLTGEAEEPEGQS